jgi:hypothetical protein
MRKFFTAVLEQGNTYEGPFCTEPFEAGWAGEALWFVRVLDDAEPQRITLTPQISPDGLVWMDAPGPALAIDLPDAGLHSAAQSNFGNWLRLRVDMAPGRPVKFLIYLALKA